MLVLVSFDPGNDAIVLLISPFSRTIIFHVEVILTSFRSYFVLTCSRHHYSCSRNVSNTKVISLIKADLRELSANAIQCVFSISRPHVQSLRKSDKPGFLKVLLMSVQLAIAVWQLDHFEAACDNRATLLFDLMKCFVS